MRRISQWVISGLVTMALWAPLARAEDGGSERRDRIRQWHSMGQDHPRGPGGQARPTPDGGQGRPQPSVNQPDHASGWHAGPGHPFRQRESWRDIHQDREDRRHDWHRIDRDRHRLWHDHRAGHREVLQHDWSRWRHHRHGRW